MAGISVPLQRGRPKGIIRGKKRENTDHRKKRAQGKSEHVASPTGDQKKQVCCGSRPSHKKPGQGTNDFFHPQTGGGARKDRITKSRKTVRRKTSSTSGKNRGWEVSREKLENGVERPNGKND